jgi:hypothetical protein
MDENICPVVRTMRDIRTGGMYVDDAEDARDRIIRVGSGETAVEYVMNDTAYYMMTRQIEFARFELTRPSAEACKMKFKKMFSDLVGMTEDTLRMHIIDKALTRKYIHEQFMRLVDLIGRIEELIMEKVNELAARPSITLNVSLPDIVFLPRIDQFIIYNPEAAEHTVNKIIDYVNKININSILPEPVNTKIEYVPAMKAPPLTVGELIQKPTGDAAEMLRDMKKTLERECAVAKYVDQVEQYHCKVINHMTQIYNTCQLLVDGLSAPTRLPSVEPLAPGRTPRT